MKHVSLLLILSTISLFLMGLPNNSKGMDVADTIKTEKPDNLPIATFAGGCFWCLESEFRALNGVVFTSSGYSGGHVENPTYQDITTGKSGHAEVTDIYYDPDIISYRELLDFFLKKAHDPTQLNRQGVDKGTQYRSAIFFHNDEQKRIAEEAIQATNEVKSGKIPSLQLLNLYRNSGLRKNIISNITRSTKPQMVAPIFAFFSKSRKKL